MAVTGLCCQYIRVEVRETLDPLDNILTRLSMLKKNTKTENIKNKINLIKSVKSDPHGDEDLINNFILPNMWRGCMFQ